MLFITFKIKKGNVYASYKQYQIAELFANTFSLPKQQQKKRMSKKVYDFKTSREKSSSIGIQHSPQ